MTIEPFQCGDCLVRQILTSKVDPRFERNEMNRALGHLCAHIG